MSAARWPTPAYQRRRALKAARRAEREKRAPAYSRPSRIARGINLAAQLLAGWLAGAKPKAVPVSKKADPLKGAVKIGASSSLRKLMRAARRGMIPAERMVVIEAAEKNAAKRKAAA